MPATQVNESANSGITDNKILNGGEFTVTDFLCLYTIEYV